MSTVVMMLFVVPNLIYNSNECNKKHTVDNVIEVSALGLVFMVQYSVLLRFSYECVTGLFTGCYWRGPLRVSSETLCPNESGTTNE